MDGELHEAGFPGDEVDVAVENVAAELVEHVAELGEFGASPFARGVGGVGDEMPADAPRLGEFAGPEPLGAAPLPPGIVRGIGGISVLIGQEAEAEIEWLAVDGEARFAFAIDVGGAARDFFFQRDDVAGGKLSTRTRAAVRLRRSESSVGQSAGLMVQEEIASQARCGRGCRRAK